MLRSFKLKLYILVRCDVDCCRIAVDLLYNNPQKSKQVLFEQFDVLHKSDVLTGCTLPVRFNLFMGLYIANSLGLTYIRALWHSARSERQSARMSEIENVG